MKCSLTRFPSGLGRWALATLLIACLTGCDYLYVREFLIPPATAPSSNVLDVVRDYARTQRLTCRTSEGVLLICNRDSTFVTVTATRSGTKVCYSAMSMPWLTGSHPGATAKLRTALESAYGPAAVKMLAPGPERCSDP